ncbi:MAG: hypothetical protein HETSPECPRED_007813 [Heterodermia speciosa]|uniref:DUF3844 domain-containing protein n=1 Tax=Heterodermia speciosa TaxID=116794 RepID=A0A8H3G0X2_9LECA|nr:MAG: hypothetical protein HETSPECPRED_007813 [Heterodermia speciosa]
MKSLVGLILACVAVRISAASSEAQVYIFPESTQPQSQPPSISPNDARLLFAQQLGVSEYHSIGDAGESTLHLLNACAGRQRPLFSDEGRNGPWRLLLIVEGVEHPEDLLDTKSIEPTFTIHDPPSSSANLDLILHLLQQDEHSRESRLSSKSHDLCKDTFADNGIMRGGIHGGYDARGGMASCGGTILIDESIEGHQMSNTAFVASVTNFDTIFYDQTSAIQSVALEDARRKQNKDAYATAAADLKDIISQIALRSVRKPFLEATVVLMPPDTSKSSKRTASPYGSYTPPSQLSRRAQPQTEEPLSALTPPSLASASSHPSTPESLAVSTSPVKGVLPVCHSSLKTATSATHNCSGHGLPYLKYQTKSSSESDVMIDCWACKCSTSVFTDKEGRTKTVYWGGPACQKKDVSVQFWILAALGIGLAATISWGIGLLYSIGDEELPSVIGAGVAGPRAQR